MLGPRPGNQDLLRRLSVEPDESRGYTRCSGKGASDESDGRTDHLGSVPRVDGRTSGDGPRTPLAGGNAGSIQPPPALVLPPSDGRCRVAEGRDEGDRNESTGTGSPGQPRVLLRRDAEGDGKRSLDHARMQEEAGSRPSKSRRFTSRTWSARRTSSRNRSGPSIARAAESAASRLGRSHRAPLPLRILMGGRRPPHGDQRRQARFNGERANLLLHREILKILNEEDLTLGGTHGVADE